MGRNVLATIVVLLGIMTVPCLAKESWLNAEGRLYKDLMKDYVKYVRPIEDPSDEMKVGVGISLVNLLDVDVARQTVQTQIWLRMRWQDAQLKWNKSDYGGVNIVRLPMEQIWRPDLMIYNSVADKHAFVADTLALATADGSVIHIPPMIATTSCVMDMYRFPFDEHTCTIKIGSWTYDGWKLNLTDWGSDVGDLTTNSEWDVIFKGTKRQAIYYPCCAEPYTDIRFTFTIKRKSTYLTHMFLAPSVTTIFVLPAVFLLPAESVDKMVLGIGVLLSQVFLLRMLEDFIPTTNPSVPRIALYFVGNVVLISLSLSITAVIVNLWHKGKRRTRMPAILRSCFLGLMGRLFCVQRDDYMPDEALSMRKGEEESDGRRLPDEDTVAIVGSYDQLVAGAEWRQLSVVLDRFFCILYIVVMIVVAISLA